MSSRIMALVGGQYGSEGKGAIAQHLASRFPIHVRSGGPNAGHTIWHQGTQYKLQQVPVGWINPKATLLLSAGALLDLATLERELTTIEQADPTVRERLFVDRNAGIISEALHQQEGGTAGELHKRIGSTGEGIGAARIARIQRDPDGYELAGDSARLRAMGVKVKDVVSMLAGEILIGRDILLEGTQGAGLSLLHGPWPYVTSHDTNAAQLAADAGIPPHKVSHVCLVLRTFPIRVAGNSGPLRGELTWDELSKRIGKPVQEHTTVTGKIRRIGTWDETTVIRSVWLNAPHSLALTFADYLNLQDEGVSEFEELSEITQSFVGYLEGRFRVPVRFIGTGMKEHGQPVTIIERIL